MFRRGTNRALAFTTVHEQPFALHYYGNGDMPNAASEAQTNGSPMGQDQEYTKIGLKDYRSILL
jgi:hypothetical protein